MNKIQVHRSPLHIRKDFLYLVAIVLACIPIVLYFEVRFLISTFFFWIALIVSFVAEW